VHVLALVHGRQGRSGVFGDAVLERGHGLEEWSLAWGEAPPRPLDEYGAVLVFGGAMHADEDDRHPWLREETLFLQRLLDVRTPVLGVCLGAQLLARAAHAPIGPAREPEIGWYEVEVTPAAADDPVLSRMPPRFHALQWHFYTYGVPGGAVELARSAICTQAFRLGDAAWGIQFHAEVSHAQVARWLAEDEAPGFDVEAIAHETEERIARWNELGRELCDAFVEMAERIGAPV
jgi:GMP synthase (glutamine-hydrolysing)